MNRTRSLLLASALCVGTVVLPGAAQAATRTIYVAPTGNDAATGAWGVPVRTLGAALKLATGGERVQLAAGVYGYARDEKPRQTEVEVVGAGIGSTKVNGLEIYGGQRLRFTKITFTGGVALTGHPVKQAAQPASGVRFDGNEFTSAGLCMAIRGGAQDITVTGNHLHDCTSGIVGQGNPNMSRRITIERNTIERIKGDGIQFGAWSDVRIAYNVIRDIVDPAGIDHNDGIQLTGSSSAVDIVGNRIFNSRSQLILIQDAIGPIDDVEVVNNLLVKAGAVALQSQGATRARFVNNTIWGGKDGGFWLRRGYARNGTYVVPTDTLASNNLTTSMRLMEGATATSSGGNVVICPTASWQVPVPAGASCVADPQFMNPSATQYWLLPKSAARTRGSWLALPSGDINGSARLAPVPGAYV